MKKLICLVLLMMLAATACAEVPGNQLGFEMLRAAYDEEENLVLSPLSLSYALAMAAQGAKGETRQEILSALEADDPADIAGLDIDSLRCANAAFLTGEIMPKAEYQSVLQDRFGAKWFSGEDATVEGINAWAAENTDGMIPKIVDELHQDSQLALVNAITMDAKWAVPFESCLNSEGVFHTPNGDAIATFMRAVRYEKYGERDGVQFLKLKYRDSPLELLIALPQEGGMNEVLDGLCKDGLGYFRFEKKDVYVNLAMPKLDIETSSSLADALKSLGIETAFTNAADFSGITEEVPLYIGSIVQNARLIMDEEGTQAAAATMMDMAAGAARIDRIVDFTMNRPFAFVIADSESGSVCFAGIVTNPLGN